MKKGNLDDAREITSVLTYFNDNTVEQLFTLFKEFGKGQSFTMKCINLLQEYII